MMSDLQDGFYWVRARFNDGSEDPDWRVGRYSSASRWFFLDGNEEAWSLDEIVEVGERIERAALTTEREKLTNHHPKSALGILDHIEAGGHITGMDAAALGFHIRAQQADIARLRAELAAKDAALAEAKEVIRPFAEEASNLSLHDKDADGPFIDLGCSESTEAGYTNGDLRRAAKWLEENK